MSRSRTSWRCRRPPWYNWRRTYGGMDTDAAKELKELREQNGRLGGCWLMRELEKDALREIVGKILGPAAKRAAIDILKEVKGMSERMAQGGWAFPLSVSTPSASTDPADPDADLRSDLRTYADKNPRHGSRRAWAHLRFDKGMTINK